MGHRPRYHLVRPLHRAKAKALVESDKLVAELLAADTIVIARPSINFSVPRRLRLGSNLVAASAPFRYTEPAPKAWSKASASSSRWPPAASLRLEAGLQHWLPQGKVRALGT